MDVYSTSHTTHPQSFGDQASVLTPHFGDRVHIVDFAMDYKGMGLSPCQLKGQFGPD